MENEVNTTPEVTEDKNTSAQETPTPKPNETENPKDINSDLFKLQVENAKYKKLVDKYSSEIAALKKEVNEKSSQQEILDREKAEAEAEKEAKAAEDHRLVQIYQAKDYYRSLGYKDEYVEKLATASADNDFESIRELTKKATEDLIKTHEEAKEKEFFEKYPQPNHGTGSVEDDDPFLKGFNSVPTVFPRP